LPKHEANNQRRHDSGRQSDQRGLEQEGDLLVPDLRRRRLVGKGTARTVDPAQQHHFEDSSRL